MEKYRGMQGAVWLFGLRLSGTGDCLGLKFWFITCRLHTLVKSLNFSKPWIIHLSNGEINSTYCICWCKFKGSERCNVYQYLAHSKFSIHRYYYLVVILLLNIENTGADMKLRGRYKES